MQPAAKSASATAEVLTSVTAELLGDNDFWKTFARHAGPFAFVCPNGSAHILKWAPPPTKATPNGVIGFYEHIASFPPEHTLAHTGSSRVHVCRVTPCSVMHGCSKYGYLPPPVAHGRVVQLHSAVSSLQWTELAEQLASPSAERCMEPAGMGLASATSERCMDPAGEVLALPDTPPLLASLPPPPLPPPATMPSLLSESPIVALIVARAAEVRKLRQDSGLFDFVAFAAMTKRRVLLRLSGGVCDLVMNFAPQIVDETWHVAPHAAQIAATRWQHNKCVMGALSDTKHFMACFRTTPMNSAGTGIAAECLRQGWAAVETVADGDCGIDALCLLSHSNRSLVARIILRSQLAAFMETIAADPTWHDVWRVLETELLPPEVIGRTLASVSAESNVADVVSASAAAVSSPASAAGAIALACPEPSVEGRMDEGRGPAHEQTAISTEVHVDRQRLESAVRWGVGLAKASSSLLNRMVGGLSSGEAQQLVAKHDLFASAAAEDPPSPPSKSARTFTKMVVDSRRAHSSRPLHSRLDAATLFTQFARKEGFKLDERIPHGKMAEFVRMTTDSSLSRKEVNKIKCAMRRAVKLLLSGRSSAPPVGAMGQCSGQRFQRFYNRKRRSGHQGAPRKAPMLRTELWDWFCSIKRSVCGRISPKMVLTQARLMSETYALACLQRGEPSNLPIIDKSWLHTWKHEFSVSFRLPNRKWSVPRAILKERLRNTWMNVIRARTLALATVGHDLPLWNFDQSPFHMNEAGSKARRSLSVRGVAKLVIKEGHSASRERWSANTMTTSEVSQFHAGIPPLEVMFRVESSGVHLLPRLRSCIPNWAPWLSVAISQSGSYNEEHILRYLNLVLPRVTPETPWRILVVDAFKAQTTEAVRAFAWSRKFVLVVHGGGATSICQPNDTDLHQDMKRVYMELEMSDAVLHQRLRPGCCPVPRKEDCLAWMGAIWGERRLHEKAALGFKNVGLSNALDGTEDGMICREARVYWDELGMSEAKQEAIATVREEVLAGRLQWSRRDVEQVVLPHPERGRVLDFLPDDEGSASWVSSDCDDADFGSDDDDDNSDGGANVKASATAVSSEKDVAPATAVTDSLVSLTPAESSVVSEHLSRISTLSGVLEQLSSTNYEALKVHVQAALHSEERRARGRLQTNAAVASAMILERQREIADVAREQLRLVGARDEKAKTALTIKALVAEQGRLEQARAVLLKASTAVECMNAVRSFDVTDLGNGHVAGGTAEHARNRMNVLDRLRMRFPPLTAEQQNDWGWFKKRWDHARINRMDAKVRDSWGHNFKEMALRLLRQLRDGDTNALSRWMDNECNEYLAGPSLRV